MLIRLSAPLLAALVALAAGCTASPHGGGPSSASVSSPPASVWPASAPTHDPAHPPIDCPLAKQGIDPASLKPFDQVEKYVAFLERPDRATWQRPDAVVAALGLTGRETIVDVGAGSGYFTFRFARALPQGKVVATDIEPEMVRHLHHRALSEGVHNVEPVLARADDPGVSTGADVVFVCDVLHHVADPAAWLAKLAGQMQAGARLVLVEFKEGSLPEGPPEAMKIPRARLLSLVKGAGLVLDGERPELLPYQTFLVFRKA